LSAASLQLSSAQSFDVVIAGGGLVGIACALASARAGMRVALVERDTWAGGATGAAMGHIVLMNDSEAHFQLTRRGQQLWHELAPSLPADAAYQAPGTLWIAANEEELDEATRKHAWFAGNGIATRLLSAEDLAAMEPQLRSGLAGALLVEEDAIVAPVAAALHLVAQAQSLGVTLMHGRAIQSLADGEAILDDGARLRAPRLLNALGAEAARLTPSIPVKKRKGQLAITDPYPGFVHRQLVELGYLQSANFVEADSVAFNVQPRRNGQLLIGSSRQFGQEDAAVDQPMLAAMFERASDYLPALPSLKVQRVWTGFRAATPDKLPLIGPLAGDPSVWLATGHEGLGITTSLVTAELLVAMFAGAETSIPVAPYRPNRFAPAPNSETIAEEKP
jgi:glycine/D-amino acid oxidase-like deaminating enzyme